MGYLHAGVSEPPAGVTRIGITSCENAGDWPDDHFVGINKKVALGSGAEREVEDFLLTRYACYLIAPNGDPSKDAIAFAQTYFAVQTRKQELRAQRIDERERISAHKKLTESERAPARRGSLLVRPRLTGQRHPGPGTRRVRCA